MNMQFPQIMQNIQEFRILCTEVCMKLKKKLTVNADINNHF